MTTNHKLIDGIVHLLTDDEIASMRSNEESYKAEQSSKYIKSKIGHLENSITNRRLREAILGIDNGWLSNIDCLVTELRSKL